VASSLHIIYASSSGNTEYTVDTLMQFLQENQPDLTVTKQLAETAQEEDLHKADALLLACGTWNTGGSEGQLHMYMDAFLRRAKDADLGGKPCALIALGEDTYYYSCRATEHLMQYIMKHNGTTCSPPLLVVNDPYGQEDKIQAWGEKLGSTLQAQ